MIQSVERSEAQVEINKTLYLCNLCTRKVGISFIDEPANSFKEKLKNYSAFVISAVALLLLVIGEIAYVLSILASSASVAEFVASLHIVGYGSISVGKMAILWYKRHEFRQLVNELPDLWPVRTNDDEALEIKRRSLTALRIFQLWYTAFNQLGVVLYNLTPIFLYVYRKIRGPPSDLGYVWHVVYPFDKHKPIYHELVFTFEAFAGQASVWFMLSSDLLFTTMTSHISMLLRLLQLKIRRLAEQDDSQAVQGTKYLDCSEEIISCIKVHQRLIKYFNDLEDAFSLVNLINVLLSSVDICCVVFVIVLLEPWMEVSNKFFLCAAVTQMGILCWYADDICTASVELADAVYGSGWYRSNTKCRRYLLSILQRSQKPLYFTAMKFNNITMGTYASILTTAYSYFALLYTMYSEN